MGGPYVDRGMGMIDASGGAEVDMDAAAAAAVQALKAAGYAVVKLPESSHTDDSDTVFWGDSIPVRVRWSNDIVVDNSVWIRSGEARSLAAALLAAADAAEASR